MNADAPAADELAALRAEVAELRRDLDRALERLDLPNSRDRREGESEWANMAFKQVSVRHERMAIPVIVYSDTDGSGVSLYDAQRRIRGRFGIDPDGQARLEILNAAGHVAVSIGEGGEGRGELRANDADGATRAGVKVSDLGGVLSVVNPQGKVLAAVTSHEAGGRVFVCSAGLRAVGMFQATTHGGALTLSEPGGQTMGQFVVGPPGSVLTIYGEQGAPAVTASGVGPLGGTLMFFNVDGEGTGILPWEGRPPA